MTELTTYNAAIAQMGDLAQSKWVELSQNYDDLADMRFPDTELSFGKPPLTKIWSRFSTVNALGTKTSVGSPINSKARHSYNGLLYVQLFCSLNVENGPSTLRMIAEEIRDHFRSARQTDSVVYRNARIDELSNDGTFYQFRVIVEYEFDELG